MRWPWQRSPLADLNYLELVPRRIVQSDPGGAPSRVLLLMPRYRDPVFGRLVQPHLRGERRFIRVPLDPRGSWLWAQVDGEMTVGELVQRFREAFPEETEQVEERLCHYVAAMVGHGFMAVDLGG